MKGCKKCYVEVTKFNYIGYAKKCFMWIMLLPNVLLFLYFGYLGERWLTICMILSSIACLFGAVVISEEVKDYKTHRIYVKGRRK